LSGSFVDARVRIDGSDYPVVSGYRTIHPMALDSSLPRALTLAASELMT
jgi:hypothetical protein